MICHRSQCLRAIQKVVPLISPKMLSCTFSSFNPKNLNIVKRNTTGEINSFLHLNTPKYKVFEPDYLDSAGLVPPTYPPINIQIKGYNFEILESFQSFIHNMAENIGIDVAEAWATPATTWQAFTYAEESTVVQDTYQLDLYERNIQIVNVQTIDLPILIDIIRKTLPEGVQLSIHENKDENQEARYIPDPFIDTLKSEIKELTTKKQERIDEALAEKAAKGKLK